MIDLKSFVSETISQIIEGVEDAQERTKGKNSAVVPTGQGTKDESLLNQMVEFDIGVIAKSDKKTSGGIGIVVGLVTLGSKGNSSSETSSSNRVKFSVPIHLPGQKVPK